MATGWGNLLFTYCSLGYELRRGFISQGDIKPGNLWLRERKGGMTFCGLRCRGQTVEVCEQLPREWCWGAASDKDPRGGVEGRPGTKV